MNKILICGSRGFHDWQLLDATMQACFLNMPAAVGNTEIITGGAAGADRMGDTWARQHSLISKIFPAQWDKYGKSAGYRRNAEMLHYLQEGDGNKLVIAFWDGVSHGTKHMIDITQKANIPVRIAKF